MADSQNMRDKRYKRKWEGKGYAKICVRYPVAFRDQLDVFVKSQREKWEKVRNEHI